MNVGQNLRSQKAWHLYKPANVVWVNMVLDCPLRQLVPFVIWTTIYWQPILSILVLTVLQVIHHLLTTRTKQLHINMHWQFATSFHCYHQLATIKTLAESNDAKKLTWHSLFTTKTTHHPKVDIPQSVIHGQCNIRLTNILPATQHASASRPVLITHRG